PQGNPPSGTPPQGGGEGGPGGGPQGDGDQSTSGSVSDGSYAAGDKEATTSDDGTYLRGAQMTDSEGIVRFTSIYPGWYVSRTVHIHVKVHIDRKTVLTTQLFFDDTLSDTINADVSPYNEHKNRDTYNDTDKIFTKEGLVKAEYDGTKVLAAINIGIAA
ncbi:Dioxygenase, partial [Corynebacterium matruchotii ATCC 33806]